MARYLQRDELQHEALDLLQGLLDLTKAQQVAIGRGEMREVENLDPKLEAALGKKERSFGALRQHKQEDGC